jgi:hypothetical protein
LRFSQNILVELKNDLFLLLQHFGIFRATIFEDSLQIKLFSDEIRYSISAFAPKTENILICNIQINLLKSNY